METADRFTASLTDEGRYRLLIEAVTDYAIYMLDPEGIVTSWNPGAQRFKGYTAEEIIGQHFSRFYTEEDRRDGLPERALETARREGRFESEGWRVRKDGTRFRAYVVIDPIRRPDGGLVGFAKITRDITERWEAQQKLEETREILVQSQKMEALGQLTGGIAHDFNNLLMIVLGSLELMRRRLPNDRKLIALLDNAMQGAERGTALAKRMLAFARRQEFKREPVHVPALVLGMRTLMERALGPSMPIETRFPLALKPVLADANQLEMALLNLAVNARDAMPNGGEIVISAYQRNVLPGDPSGLAPGAYVSLSVADSGTGMDRETLRRATEPFFTTKGPGRGTGLGLSMVHGVVEQCGGRFLLQSKLGQGTRAELLLPVAPEPAQPQEEPPPARVEAAAPTPLAVVAVDDDELVLTNTVGMLEDLGHSVRAALSGEEALDLIRADPAAVDLVVTDQAMPEMSGLQLAEAIGKEWPDMPILITTGYSEMPPGTVTDLPLLSKPFTQDLLAERLARIPPRRPSGARVLKLRSAAAEGDR
ncbi:MAG TPA: PAS domain S-box protein [Pseudolabrys sp.]|nr:PAS domain S-box protein [Pseudolabrys sp.]